MLLFAAFLFLAVYIASSIISSGIASVGTLAIKKEMNGESAYIPLEIMRSILSEYTIGVLFTAAVLFIFFFIGRQAGNHRREC